MTTRPADPLVEHYGRIIDAHDICAACGHEHNGAICDYPGVRVTDPPCPCPLSVPASEHRRRAEAER